MQPNLLMIFLGAFLVNNIILMRFLGLCSFFGVSKKISVSIGMSFAVMFVMTISAWTTMLIYHLILVKYNLIYLRTATFILTIAGTVQFVEMFLKKYVKNLYKAMGIFLPLITTNCAILAVTFLSVDFNYNFVETTIYSIGVGMGYLLAIVLISSLRERLETTPIPQFLKGYPLVFITAGLMSLAFLGFSGLFGVSL
ncbi:electron transport complex subunit RsxA [candidate division TA06 bacterium]|uniref:Ion-translocating oxidoreductase complex subunit A n=1 Tax=candidate division TA06 bacterium TaxID=2250710 RepID=A0A660SPP2_UNCT6|nr:MAG: electron transport complex subunit RsxA [candidate division TA06 bacterium]